MPAKFSIEFRTEIVLLRASHTARKTAEIFNDQHPDRASPLSLTTVCKIFKKFIETGSVVDKKSTGRPHSAINEANQQAVLDRVQVDPHVTTRAMARGMGISAGSVVGILKNLKFHPYKNQILHKMKPADYSNRICFHDNILSKVESLPNFHLNILWTDQSVFTLQGLMSKQSYR